MKKEKRASGDGSAAKGEFQPKTTASAAVPAAAPQGREEAMDHRSARRQRLMNSPLQPSLSMWAAGNISDVDALLYMAESICEHGPAFTEFANGRDEPNRADTLVILSVIKGIGTGNAITHLALMEGEVSFPSLPGLLGRRKVKVREVLEYASWFLVGARELIEKKIIPGMKDRRAALKLAESLVLAEAELDRDCDAGKNEVGSGLELARQVLAEAMLQGEAVAGN